MERDTRHFGRLARDTFRRATGSLQRFRVPVEARSRSRLFGTERRHANLLVRDVRSTGKSVVRQLVREVVDAVGATLAHRAVGQFEHSASGEMRKETVRPPEVGARYTADLTFLGRRLMISYEVSAYEPPRLFVFRSLSGPLHDEYTYTLKRSQEEGRAFRWL